MPRQDSERTVDELAARIDQLPINAAHRDAARAHFTHVEHALGWRFRTVRALIGGTFTFPHGSAMRKPHTALE